VLLTAWEGRDRSVPFAASRAARDPFAPSIAERRLESIARRNRIRAAFATHPDADPFDEQSVADVEFLLALVTAPPTRPFWERYVPTMYGWWSRIAAPRITAAAVR
jgi:hypothetical protein